MSKSKLAQKDIPEQGLDGIFKTLWKLNEGFDEDIKPHIDSIKFLSSVLTEEFISDTWTDDFAASMSSAIEKLLLDAADALEDFDNLLSETLSAYRDLRDQQN